MKYFLLTMFTLLFISCADATPPIITDTCPVEPECVCNTNDACCDGCNAINAGSSCNVSNACITQATCSSRGTCEAIHTPCDIGGGPIMCRAPICEDGQCGGWMAVNTGRWCIEISDVDGAARRGVCSDGECVPQPPARCEPKDHP